MTHHDFPCNDFISSVVMFEVVSCVYISFCLCCLVEGQRHQRRFRAVVCRLSPVVGQVVDWQRPVLCCADPSKKAGSRGVKTMHKSKYCEEIAAHTCHFITPHPSCGSGSIIWHDWVLIAIYCVVKVSERLNFVGKQIHCQRSTESATVGCWLYIHLLFPIPPASSPPSTLKIIVDRAVCCFWHSGDRTGNWITLANNKSRRGLFWIFVIKENEIMFDRNMLCDAINSARRVLPSNALNM